MIEGERNGEEAGLSNLENRFMLRAAQLHKDSLARQFHYGVFYSWVKLRELEAKHLPQRSVQNLTNPDKFRQILTNAEKSQQMLTTAPK